MNLAALVDTRHEYYRVFDVYVPIAVGIFLFILLVVTLAVIVYRRRPPQRAARRDESNPLEGTYALLLAAVAAFLLYLTFTAEHRTDTLANDEHPAVVEAAAA